MFFIKNLLVFFGGKSPERDVSVITGLLTLNSLNKQIYNPIPVFVNGDGKFFTGENLKDINFYRTVDYSKLYQLYFTPGEPYAYAKLKSKTQKTEVYSAINCMHGRGGEDGVLVGLLRLCNIPFVSPDLFASALSIDKDFTKIVADGLKIKTAPYLRIKRGDFFAKSKAYLKFAESKLGYPIIVKPARLGSSIGIKKAENQNELFNALCEAFNYDDKVICEPFMQGARDLNCAVYKISGKLTVSEIEEAMHQSEILSFADKYGGGDKAVGSCRKKPTDLVEKTVEEIKKISKTLYRKLDFSSIVRFDFLIWENAVYLNEINAVPGSLAYYFFCEKTAQFGELLHALIEDSREQNRKEGNFVTFYSSKILYGNFESVKK